MFVFHVYKNIVFYFNFFVSHFLGEISIYQEVACSFTKVIQVLKNFLLFFSSKTIISSNGDIVNDTNALLVETVNW